MLEIIHGASPAPTGPRIHRSKSSPPTSRGPKNYKSRYSPILDELMRKSPGEWISVPCDAINGKTPAIKQATIWSAAKGRGLTVNTAVRDSRLYLCVRLVPVSEKES